MRLINTQSMSLEQFDDERKVQYAILSHRWEDEEVTFSDVQSAGGLQNLVHRKGFQKIAFSCQQAQRDGWQYVWVDTCCIDKSSSAELSEAINSMYRWYHVAKICYVYLSDVGSGLGTFASSAWFTRGWTLQELLAPADLTFYDCDWRIIGARSELMNKIQGVTGIDKAALSGPRNLEGFSIAERMSWASCRQNSREEDMAYSLMGIFGVNMPMLYGEGAKAFFRLQEAIIGQSNDQTIFAWTYDTGEMYTGLLAASPKFFANSTGVRRSSDGGGPSYMMTNKGLSIELEMIPWLHNMYLARLDAWTPRGFSKIAICIQSVGGTDQFVRVTMQPTIGFNFWPTTFQWEPSLLGEDGERRARKDPKRKSVHFQHFLDILGAVSVKEPEEIALPYRFRATETSRKYITSIVPAFTLSEPHGCAAIIQDKQAHTITFLSDHWINATDFSLDPRCLDVSRLIVFHNFDFELVCIVVRKSRDTVTDGYLRNVTERLFSLEAHWGERDRTEFYSIKNQSGCRFLDSSVLNDSRLCVLKTSPSGSVNLCLSQLMYSGPLKTGMKQIYRRQQLSKVLKIIIRQGLFHEPDGEVRNWICTLQVSLEDQTIGTAP